MGLARGLFMMDTHTVGQGDEHVAALLYHMEKYRVDMCLIKATIGMSNQMNADTVKKYPDKFIAICNDEQTQLKNRSGEKPWNIKDAAEEIDRWMSTGQFKGIGDGLARDRNFRKKLVSWDERLDQICQLFELGRKYKCPMIYHVGLPIGAFGTMDLARARAHAEMCDNGNPLLCHEVAALYPDVPIILAHSGIESSGYYMDDYEKCLNVAASHHNVFLETGQWWAELYYKPLKDPNIGAKKMVWGCGWGEPLMQQWMPGEIPATSNFGRLDRRGPGGAYDIWGWSLRELGRLNIPQDDLNLILGGNAAYLYKVKTPLPYERLFKKVDRLYENA